MYTIVDLIDRALKNPENPSVLKDIADEVHDLMEGRPLFVVENLVSK